MAVFGPVGDSGSYKDGAKHCGEIKMYHKKTIGGLWNLPEDRDQW